MLENMTDRYQRSREMFSGLSTTNKVLLMAGAAGILALIIFVLIWANRTDYAVIYSDLSQEDAAAIVDLLDKRKTPYKLSQNATTVEVPKDQIQELRLYLATEGLPVGGSVGMEMFNESRLGETDFLQQLNFQRALQGELERTIKQFPEVDQVRVHLNIPKEALFIEEERPPSASVVLKLRRGKSLSRSQLQGIVHLVASSVEGLTPDNISVVDTDGGLLYSKDDKEDTGLLTSAQSEQKTKMEKNLSSRVTAMLERIVGPDKALTRVNAEINFERIATDEEIYDPDRTAIRSEQRLKETNEGPARGASGIPQSTFELGTGNEEQNAAGSPNEKYERTEDTTNYEITRVTRRIITPAGDIKRLSVAVMVDGTYQESATGDQAQRTYVPRPQSELDRLTELVKNAVGYDETRGDTVVVQSVPFYIPIVPPKTWSEKIWDFLPSGKNIFYIFLIVLFFLFIVRPVMGILKQKTAPEMEAVSEMEALPEGEGHEALPDMHKVPSELSRDEVLLLAQQNPEKTVNLLRSWIDEG